MAQGQIIPQAGRTVAKTRAFFSKSNSMHSLEQIIKMNNKAAVKAETNFDRHCSFQGDAKSGVVLHSAKLRNTVFVPAGRKAERFLSRWWSVNSQEQRDALVERYFV